MKPVQLKKLRLCIQYIPRLKRTCQHRVENGYKKCYQHRKSKFPRPSECPICTFTFSGYYVPLNPCKHWVCPNCIIRSGKKECPLCRTVIKVPTKHIAQLRKYADEMKKYVIDANISLLPETLQEDLRNLMNSIQEEISLIDCSEIDDNELNDRDSKSPLEIKEP